MSEWSNIITDDDLAVYAAAGFGGRSSLGGRAAVLVIDIQYRTVGRRRLPIEQSIREEYPTSCGTYGWDAVDRLAPVLRLARSHDVPVIYPHVAPKIPGALGRLGEKVPAIESIDLAGYDFVAEIAPEPGDLLIPKKHPSAFYGTDLLSELVNRRVDTLLIAGATTSGCVRATVTDAFSMNFRVGVIRDAVFDRGQISHKVNLFDLSSKYCELLTSEEASALISERSELSQR